MIKRRLGTFRIHSEMLDRGNHNALRLMFGRMIVLEARHDYSRLCVVYVAESDLFEPIEDYRCAPEYEIMFTRMGANLLIDARRCDPAPVLNFSFKQKVSRLKMAIKGLFK